MKKLICIFLTIFGLFFIYHHFDSHQIKYVSIGDGLIRGMDSRNQINYGYNDFVKEYLEKKGQLFLFNNSFYNKKIEGLIDDVKKNRTIWNNNNEYYIKKLLRESDVLVISVGMEELMESYDKFNMDNNYIYFDKMYNEIEKLIMEIKKYAKGTILFVGYYNPTTYYDSKTDEFFCDMDIKLNRLMMVNDISYIDMYEIVKGNRYKDNLDTPFLNIRGYERLAKSIEFYFN